MGCGSSNMAYEPEQPGYKGILTITIKHAVLEKDVLWLGTMDPYVKLRMEDQTFTSQVCQDGGKFPKWTGQLTSFKKKIGKEDVITAQVWSKNTITSDVLLGEGAFSLTSIRKGTASPVEIPFLIYEKGTSAGSVTVEVIFSLDPTGKDFPEIKAPNTLGKLSVEPKQANLTRDVNLLTTMDPLITFRFGNESMSSAVSTNGGKTPKWSDTIHFTREVNEDTLYIEVWNFSEYGSNDLVGIGYVSITDTLSLKEKIAKTVPIFFEDHPAGDVTLAYTFQTSEPQKYFPQNNEVQPQQHNQQQTVTQQIQMVPQQLANFTNNIGQRMGSVFGQNAQGNRVEFTYPNGDHYSGELLNNQRFGQGRLTFVYGGFYVGQFANDTFNGQGELVQGDSRYSGLFVNGKKNGQGFQEWNNGQKYDGEWVENNMHGNGEWTFPNGAKKKGVWGNGNRLRWLDESQNTLQMGKTLPQGGSIHSSNGVFTLNLSYEGKLYIYNNQTRMPVFRADYFNRAILAPFWLRLENHGELILMDISCLPYWTSGRGQPNFQAPYMLVLEDDGRLIIYDANRVAKWYSH